MYRILAVSTLALALCATPAAAGRKKTPAPAASAAALLTQQEELCKVRGEYAFQIATSCDLGTPLTTVLRTNRKHPRTLSPELATELEAWSKRIILVIYDVSLAPRRVQQYVEPGCLRG
jgi:hypothetical protein